MDKSLSGESVTLINWAVKYDDFYGMPQLIQGVVVGGKNSGRPIQITGIQSLDLKVSSAKTDFGLNVFLIGEGSRIFIVKEKDIVKLQNNVDLTEKIKLKND